MPNPDTKWLQAAAGIKKAREASLRRYEAAQGSLGEVPHPRVSQTDAVKHPRPRTGGAGRYTRAVSVINLTSPEELERAGRRLAKRRIKERAEARKAERAVRRSESRELKVWEKVEESEIANQTSRREINRVGGDRRARHTVFDAAPDSAHSILRDPGSPEEKIGGLVEYQRRKVAGDPSHVYAANKSLHLVAADENLKVSEISSLAEAAGIPADPRYQRQMIRRKAATALAKQLGLPTPKEMENVEPVEAKRKLPVKRRDLLAISESELRPTSGLQPDPDYMDVAMSRGDQFMSERGKEILRSNEGVNKAAQGLKLTQSMLKHLDEYSPEDQASILQAYRSATKGRRALPPVAPELAAALQTASRNARESFAVFEEETYKRFGELKKKITPQAIAKVLEGMPPDEAEILLKEITRRGPGNEAIAFMDEKDQRRLDFHMGTAERDLSYNAPARNPRATYSVKSVNLARKTPAELAGSLTPKQMANQQIIHKLAKAQKAYKKSEAKQLSMRFPGDRFPAVTAENVALYGSRGESFAADARYKAHRYGQGFFASDRPGERGEARAVAMHPSLLEDQYGGAGKALNPRYSDLLEQNLRTGAKRLRSGTPGGMAVGALVGLLSARLG